MYIGAAYYPELWDESEIEQDIERCRQYGINCLRVGEFAWGKMEPEENRFEFDWLERIVDRLWQAGIHTLMCTPTCTPPRWFLNWYPETRQISPNGVRQEVSSRCHPCKTSPVMREKNRQIVTRMAERFGKHPGIIGWQIDNELFPYQGGCYCGLCQEAFRSYLKHKYQDIANLNRKWGMSRWSLEYSAFEEIQPPKPDEWRHPSLRTAWRSFQCRQIDSYINEQAEILHRYSKAPVGTDMMQNNTLSYYHATEQLDVVQFNHYEPAERTATLPFIYNFLRPVKERPFWVTETQVGWNGSEFSENGYRPVGNCYVNTWLPIAMGGEMNLYWLFRTHSNGHELAHGALFSTCGRPYRVSDEVRRASGEIEICRPFLEQSRIRSEIAIHYSTVAEHNFASAPMLKGFSYAGTLRKNVYGAFRHCNVDVIDTMHSPDGYRVIISPFLTTIDDETRTRMVSWVENGGTWIAGPMSDILTDDTVKPTDAPFFFLEELAGVYTRYQKPIDNTVFQACWADGTPLEISGCFDAFEPTDSHSLAAYSAGEFEGFSVMTERKVGKGRVILLGSMISHADWRRLVGYEPIADASENLYLVERTGTRNGMVVLELENRPGWLELKHTYKDLLRGTLLHGRVEIAPYHVLVLERT